MPSPVKSFASKLDLPIFQPASLRGEAEQQQFESLKPDAAVVAAYGMILPRGILNTPRLGCLNIHPSLLPRHRGASPVPAAILCGDEVTGATVMLLDEGLDTGPVVAQVSTPIGGNETAGELTLRLFEMGADLLIRVLPDLDDGTLRPAAQRTEDATMTGRLSRRDGRIDWSAPARRIERMVRAYHPWPGTYTAWDERTIKILEAAVSDSEAAHFGPPGTVMADRRSIEIATGDGALRVLRLQLEGRRAVSASEFVTGHGGIDGAVLG